MPKQLDMSRLGQYTAQFKRDSTEPNEAACWHCKQPTAYTLQEAWGIRTVCINAECRNESYYSLGD